MSTSIRLSADVMKRVARLAQASDVTPHAFMLQAIEEKLEAEELHQAMVVQAEERLARMKKRNVGIPADEVFTYFRRRASGKPAHRPKPRALR